MLMFASKDQFKMHNERVRNLGFRATLVALFVLKCWLGEFPLSEIANPFEL